MVFENDTNTRPQLFLIYFFW